MTFSGISAVVLCLPLLAACATGGSGKLANDPECAYLDCEKMARVSRAAREQGLGLIWVNPPPKPSSTAAAPAGS